MVGAQGLEPCVERRIHPGIAEEADKDPVADEQAQGCCTGRQFMNRCESMRLDAKDRIAEPVCHSPPAFSPLLSTATGKSASSREIRRSIPPSNLSPVNTSRQVPGGRTKVVAPQSAVPSRYSR